MKKILFFIITFVLIFIWILNKKNNYNKIIIEINNIYCLNKSVNNKSNNFFDCSDEYMCINVKIYNNFNDTVYAYVYNKSEKLVCSYVNYFLKNNVYKTDLNDAHSPIAYYKPILPKSSIVSQVCIHNSDEIKDYDTFFTQIIYDFLLKGNTSKNLEDKNNEIFVVNQGLEAIYKPSYYYKIDLISKSIIEIDSIPKI